MPASIQPITDAIRRGDKNTAIALIKEALNTDPKDIDALLLLATMVEEPTRKRQVLNRILSVVPTHKAAREMMLELDRAEMGGYRLSPERDQAVDAKPVPPPSPVFSESTRHEPQTAATTKPAPTPPPRAEKPLVFRPSTVWVIFLYLFTTLFCCAGLLAARQSLGSGLSSLLVALLFGLGALSLSFKIEVKESGIRSSTLLGSSEIQWNDIASIKSNSMSNKLELVSNKGKSVKISTQVKGYPAVIEILRQKRPDLFGAAQDPAAHAYERLQPTMQLNSPAFTGSKTFQKSFFKQYGLSFTMAILALLFAWLGLASTADTRTVFLIATGFCALMIFLPFFQVSGIRVEPDKLILQSFFEEKEFTAQQIKEIKMQSVQGRYGRVTNFVNVIPAEGKRYPLSGFPEGEEILYGFLMNWWNRYQSR